MKTVNFKFKHNQSGAVLIVSLLFLLIVTVIGVSSMQSVTLEERMAGNMRDTDIAFQAAEATLREAEKWVEDNLDHPDDLSGFNDAGGKYALDTHVDVSADSTEWGSAIEYTTTINGLSSQPKYVAQYAGVIPGSGGSIVIKPLSTTKKSGKDSTAIEITARGAGKSANTVVILRSLYGVQL